MSTIPCRHCNGTGIEALPEQYECTLKLFVVGKQRTAQECFDAKLLTGTVGVTAWNNRLRRMMEMGLLKREKRGREWRYSRA